METTTSTRTTDIEEGQQSNAPLYSANTTGNIVLGVIATMTAIKLGSVVLGSAGYAMDSALNPEDEWSGFGGVLLGTYGGAFLIAIAMIVLASLKGTRQDTWVAGATTLAMIPLTLVGFNSLLGLGFGLGGF